MSLTTLKLYAVCVQSMPQSMPQFMPQSMAMFSHPLTTYSKGPRSPSSPRSPISPISPISPQPVQPVQPVQSGRKQATSANTHATSTISTTHATNGVIRPTNRYGQFTLSLNKKTVSIIDTPDLDALKAKIAIRYAEAVSAVSAVQYAARIAYLKSVAISVEMYQNINDRQPEHIKKMDAILRVLVEMYPDGLPSIPSNRVIQSIVAIESIIDTMHPGFQNSFEDSLKRDAYEDNLDYDSIRDELALTVGIYVNPNVVVRDDDNEEDDDRNDIIEGNDETTEWNDDGEGYEWNEWTEEDEDNIEENGVDAMSVATNRCSGTCLVVSTANNTHFAIRWNNAHAKRQHEMDSLRDLDPSSSVPYNHPESDSTLDCKRVSGSTGMFGFKGTKRGTPHAAETTAYTLARKVKSMCRYQPEFHLILCGTGRGRSVVLKSLTSGGINVMVVSDATPFAHNGCRTKKPRRI